MIFMLLSVSDGRFRAAPLQTCAFSGELLLSPFETQEGIDSFGSKSGGGSGGIGVSEAFARLIWDELE